MSYSSRYVAGRAGSAIPLPRHASLIIEIYMVRIPLPFWRSKSTCVFVRAYCHVEMSMILPNRTTSTILSS